MYERVRAVRGVRVRGEGCGKTSPDDVQGAVDMTTATQAGQAGLQGWRAKAADAIAKPVANHTNLNEDQVRAVVGAAFFILAVIYVANSLRALARSSGGRRLR